jgi:hypothetical protein
MSVPEYTGYFDESGDDHFMTISGYVSTPLKWSRLNKEWIAVLSEYGIPFFHMKEYVGGRGIFQGLSKENRDNMYHRLIDIVNRHTMFGVTGGVILQDFKDVTKDLPDNPHPYMTDPWVLCFFQCLGRTITQMKKKTASYEQVALIFDRKLDLEGRALKYFNWYSKERTDGNRLASLAFASAKDTPAIQAADIIAYESRKELRSKKIEPSRPVRISLEKLLSKNRLDGGYLDKIGLSQIVSQMESGKQQINRI